MIVHCHYDMTETSSIHCFTRCLTRCFGVGRRTNATKSTAEPAQNGCMRTEDDKSKGNTVKTREPLPNGYNKQLLLGGEKSCCVPVIKSYSNESPYIYSQHSGGKMVLNEDTVNISEGHLPNINERADNEKSFSRIQNIDAKTEHDMELVSLSNCNDQTSLIIGDKSQILQKNNYKESSTIQSDSDKLSPYKIRIAVNNTDHTNALEKDISSKNAVNIISESNETKVCSRTNSYNDHSSCDLGSVEKTYSKPALLNEDCRIEEINMRKFPQNNLELSHHETPKITNDVSEGEHDILYFKNLLKQETSKLEQLLQKWEEVLLDHPHIHEEVCDEIRSLNGQTHLVISERFTQFKSLVEQSEKQALHQQLKDTKIITLSDLQGFWDMIYYQVQDVSTKFQRLDKIEQSGWNHEILHENDKKLAQKKVVKKTTDARKRGNTKSKIVANQSNGISDQEKARRIAARKRLAEARKKMAAQSQTQNGDIMQY
ncbi:uncharacterized protein LOC120337312 [Styela clava]